MTTETIIGGVLMDAEKQTGALVALVTSARNSIEAFIDFLPPRLFDSAVFVDALRTFLLRHPQRQVRLCLQQSSGLQAQCPNLLELAGRLPSRISCRLAAVEHHDLTRHFVLADRTQCLRRIDPNAREWLYDPDDHDRARLLGQNFDTFWQHAEPHPEFRRLSL